MGYLHYKYIYIYVYIYVHTHARAPIFHRVAGRWVRQDVRLTSGGHTAWPMSREVSCRLFMYVLEQTHFTKGIRMCAIHSSIFLTNKINTFFLFQTNLSSRGHFLLRHSIKKVLTTPKGPILLFCKKPHPSILPPHFTTKLKVTHHLSPSGHSSGSFLILCPNPSNLTNFIKLLEVIVRQTCHHFPTRRTPPFERGT